MRACVCDVLKKPKTLRTQHNHVLHHIHTRQHYLWVLQCAHSCRLFLLAQSMRPGRILTAYTASNSL